MTASCRFAAVALAAMALGMTAVAQSSAPCTLGVHNFIGFGMSAPVVRGGTAPPFSGTVKTTFEQRLGDGNSIHAMTRTHVARDSKGKTRTEIAQTCERGLDGELQVVKSVSVNDTANKTSMKVVRIFHQNEILVKQPPPPQQSERMKLAQMCQPPRAEYRTEDLGTRTFNGVVAQGSRTVRTIPSREEGNELPLEIIDEHWASKQMGLVLMIIRDDPRQGRTTAEFEELSLGEPDPALFAVPEGYKVEDVHPNSNVAAAGVR